MATLIASLSHIHSSCSSRFFILGDAQSVDDGWVTCSGDFFINEYLSTTSEAYVRMRFFNNRDGGKYDLDYDDISMSYSKGYVDELAVESNDVSCWGIDADVHITSSTYYNYYIENGYTSRIKQVIDNSDGTTSILLKEAMTLPTISKEENDIDAVEVALLSRNVKIEGEIDEDNKGGYMQVLHTVGIPQVIQGVEFYKMGRRSEVDRFVSDTTSLCVVLFNFFFIENTDLIMLFELCFCVYRRSNCFTLVT